MPPYYKGHLPYIKGVLSYVSCGLHKEEIHQLLLAKYYTSDGSMVDEVGWSCGTYGEKIYTEFWLGNPKERGYLEDRGVDNRIILKLMLNDMGGLGWD